MSKLFVTLAILCVFGAVIVQGLDKQAMVAAFMVKMADCKVEVGAKDSDVEELVGRKPSSTMEGKCLRSCLMKKFELMDDNGKFAKDVALSHMDKFTGGSEEKIKIGKEIIDICCCIEVPDDHCEAAEQYGKCFKEQIVAHNVKDEFGL